MAPEDHRDEDRDAWRELGVFLLMVGFLVLLFLLGRAMVRHHFFSDGAQNNQMMSAPKGR